tara:strand:- start:33 stop:326 length:294 start_codon:yes stop_codon:yes gene_type:complete
VSVGRYPDWIEPPPWQGEVGYKPNPFDEFRYQDERERQYFDDVEYFQEDNRERDDDWIERMELERENSRKREVDAVAKQFKLFRTNVRANHWFTPDN